MAINSLLTQAAQALNTGDLNIAEALLKRVRLLAPKNLDALNMLGVVVFQKGQLRESRQLLEKVLKADPNNLMACYNLGNILMRAGDHGRALEYHERALRLRPNDYWILINRGVSLSQLGKFEEAMDCLREAIAVNPTQADGWQNLATCLKDSKDYASALEAYNRALERRPDYAEAWSGKGSALHSLMRYDEALACLDQAIQFNPRFAEAWSNKGATLHEMRRHSEALACFDRAIELQPDYHESYWNKSLTQLLLGDLEHGWANYRHRWQMRNTAPGRDAELPALRTLEQAKGKTVLVWAEQGFGDSLQFARYLPLLTNHAARVIFEVQPALCSLFAGQLGCEVIPTGQSGTTADYQVALLDLPSVFQTTVATIPAIMPYLRAPSAGIAYWKDALGLGADRLNIGIACSGNPAHNNDPHRSIALAQFEPLTAAASCFLLQQELRAGDREYLQRNPQIHFVGDAIRSFEDTAAIASCMDLIVTVDTSLAHLAGALGKPVWILLPWAPDWRWLQDRRDSPWYPTATLYRQAHAGDWSTVLNAVANDLHNLHPGLPTEDHPSHS